MAIDASNLAATLAQVRQAYHDNADYAEVASATKARAFVTAGRRLLQLMPAEAGGRLSNTKMAMDLIAAEVRAAEGWVAANPTASLTDGSVTRADFRNFRE